MKPLKTFWVTIDFVTGIFLNALRNQYDLDTPITKDILTGNGTDGYNEQRRCFLVLGNTTGRALRSMRFSYHAFQRCK